jgi:Uma2 family endonuclease
METIAKSPATTKKTTAVEFFGLPDHGGRHELIKGEIVEMSPASTMHGNIAMRLGAMLWSFVDEQQLGRVFAAETGFLIRQNPDTVRAPDVAFVDVKRIPPKGIPDTGFWAIVPDLAAEVISPYDRLSDIQDKVTDYLDAGVRLVWVVDPKTATVTVYESLKQVAILIGDDVLTGGAVVPGFQLPLPKLFS